MINWDDIYKIKPDEFSEDPDLYAEPDLIYGLSDVRKRTEFLLRPSPANGALARFDSGKTSQHYVGDRDNPIRLSTACDVFIEGIPMAYYSTILSLNIFNGIGIYLDTRGPDGKPWIMLHLDIREYGFDSKQPLLWIVYKVKDSKTGKFKDVYCYPQVERYFWSLLNDSRFFTAKKFSH